MLIGVLIGVAGLAIVAIAYLNRDELSEKPPVRRIAPYVAGAVAAIAIAVLVIELTAHQSNICGTTTNCGQR